MELLETMAADVIDVVKHTQRRAVIEGLSSSERRKVHTMVSEDGALETESRGEGELRYMMLSPRT
jgi:predicted RNA-binding protein Jag